MLIAHIGFSLSLIALVFGVALYLWSVRAEAGVGITLAKVIGIIVIVLSILNLLCTAYAGMRVRHFKKEMSNYYCPMMDSKQNAQSVPGNNPSATPANTTPDTPAQ